MGAIFKAPKVQTPKIQAAPPVPTLDGAMRTRTEGDRFRTRRGAAGNVFAGLLPLTTGAGTAAGKQLTGS